MMWFTDGAILAFLIPWIRPFCLAIARIHDKTSKHRMNNYEDKGSSSLKPLVRVNLPNGEPYKRIEKAIEERH